MERKLLYIKYFSESKEIFENHLVNCVKRPVYNYFQNIYDSLFEENGKNDKKVIPLFQQEMLDIQKKLSNEYLNDEVYNMIGKTDCYPYVSKLINVVLASNHKVLLLGAEVPSTMYETPIPNSLNYFRHLYRILCQHFYREPWLFAHSQPNGVRLQQINYMIDHLIPESIVSAIQSCVFNPKLLDYHLQTLDKIHLDLKRAVQSELEKQIGQSLGLEKSPGPEQSPEPSPGPSATASPSASPSMEPMKAEPPTESNVKSLELPGNAPKSEFGLDENQIVPSEFNIVTYQDGKKAEGNEQELEIIKEKPKAEEETDDEETDDEDEDEESLND